MPGSMEVFYLPEVHRDRVSRGQVTEKVLKVKEFHPIIWSQRHIGQKEIHGNEMHFWSLLRWAVNIVVLFFYSNLCQNSFIDVVIIKICANLDMPICRVILEGWDDKGKLKQLVNSYKAAMGRAEYKSFNFKPGDLSNTFHLCFQKW